MVRPHPCRAGNGVVCYLSSHPLADILAENLN